MDNLKLAWYLIHVTDLKANVVNGKNVQLSWSTTDPEATGSYKVYRSAKPMFTADQSNFVAETISAGYLDRNLDAYSIYYYKVLPVNKDGEMYFPSAGVRGETFNTGVIPSVKVTGVNTSTVKKYEKFEINLELYDVGIQNPYDPDDINVYSMFTSPSGTTMRINGFYDDYMGVGQWKIRLSPNEVGKWEYQVFVQDAGGVGESSVGELTAVESEHHGCIKPSDKNPHYFVHDDGTSYYAVGVYSPWGNNATRFETFAEHDANLFAIWDIGYGGFINSTGVIEEELGRYNQEKLGRIDSLLTILETHDIKLMYAIWPHDLFSETVWAAEWDKNPYNQFIDVADVYSDPLVWEYQKKKYRYLIARYSYSRSMGIWELINEMNGTDGWEQGRHKEAYDWVEKADKWFEENDPYNHPVTASFSGGFTEYREPLYIRNDVANLHMYPAQGWAMQYPDDVMRSAMYNYAWASRRFWDNFEKPAIFGESGADLSYFNRRDEEYHINYHNVIWATLANGLAGIPVWWQFGHLSQDDWDQLQYLSDFVSDIDFANLPYDIAEVSVDGADAYGLEAGSVAFGWVRSYSQDDISGAALTLRGLENGAFEIIWFDTWNGRIVRTETASSTNGLFSVTAPKLSKAKPDIAFKINKR